LYNIRSVAESGLCTMCGTCIGVCPTDAIKMHATNGLFLPLIDKDKCTMCGLCVKCCPGYCLDFENLNSMIFGRHPKNISLGNYSRCYVGYSKDWEIRFNSSSGGIVTHLLVFALEKGMIDGAVVTRIGGKHPLRPESFIARTRKEIISASRSKYCPTSANETLRYILKEDGKFAVVGLPCQIHGIRKAEMKIRALREKIVLHVGLMCTHTVSFYGTEFLLRKLGISPHELVEIAYRGQGWPGNMVIKLVDGSRAVIPYVQGFRAYWPVFSCFYFTPRRCLMCQDFTNELADVSVGDAWLHEFKNDKIGRSILIARTKQGQDLLDFMCREKTIFLEPVTVHKVLRSQQSNVKFKKNDFAIRMAMLESSGMKTPIFSLSESHSNSFLSFLRNLFVIANVKASENNFFKRLLVGIPFPIFKLYYGIYKFLCML